MKKVILKYTLLIILLVMGVPMVFNHFNVWVSWVLALSWAAFMINEIQKDINK